MNKSVHMITGITSLVGLSIYNLEGEKLGKLDSIAIGLKQENVAYAVLSFKETHLLKSKLFALPWKLLKFDLPRKRVLLNITKERLKALPGFDKRDWPRMEDPMWENQIANYYHDFDPD